MRLRSITVVLGSLALLSGVGLGASLLLGAKLTWPMPEPLRTVDGVMLTSAFGGLLCILGVCLTLLVALWERAKRPRYDLANIKPQVRVDAAPHERMVQDALDAAKREGVARAARTKTKRKPEPRRK